MKRDQNFIRKPPGVARRAAGAGVTAANFFGLIHGVPCRDTHGAPSCPRATAVNITCAPSDPFCTSLMRNHSVRAAQSKESYGSFAAPQRGFRTQPMLMHICMKNV